MVRILIVMAVGIGLAGCNTSYNYFQEEADSSTQRDTTAFGAFLSMTGIAPPAEEPIKYTPRPPLAMPGATALPAPETQSAAEAAVNFPKDEAQQNRERQEELARLGDESAYEREFERDSGMRRVDPKTVQRGRRNGGGLNFAGESAADSIRQRDYRLNREEMKQTFKTRERNFVMTETGEPTPRKYLAEPPADYRTPSETAAVPDKKDIENSEWAKKRLYKVNDRRAPRLQ